MSIQSIRASAQGFGTDGTLAQVGPLVPAAEPDYIPLLIYFYLIRTEDDYDCDGGTYYYDYFITRVDLLGAPHLPNNILAEPRLLLMMMRTTTRRANKQASIIRNPWNMPRI